MHVPVNQVPAPELEPETEPVMEENNMTEEPDAVEHRDEMIARDNQVFGLNENVRTQSAGNQN